MEVKRKIYKIVLALTALAAVTYAVTEEEQLISEITQLLQTGLKSNFNGFVQNQKTGSKRHLACPRPKTIMYTPREEKMCRRDKQCGDGMRCCAWFDKKHCLEGLSKTPRQGQCPKITHVNDGCIADYVGCRYDSECEEDEKCCMNTNCGYKKCLKIRQNIECPQPKTYFATKRTEKACSKDVECGLDEKCCNWHDSTHCLKGLSTIPKPGFCPVALETSKERCLADYVGCTFDSECSGVNHKCCTSHACGYGECVDMNRDFACPEIETNTLSGGLLNVPSTCAKGDTCEGFSKLCCPTTLDHNNNPLYHCVEGVYHQPRPGTCPSPSLLADPEGSCLQDYGGGCEFDDDCWEDHKCCKTQCGYSDCVNVASSTTSKKQVLKRILSDLETNMNELSTQSCTWVYSYSSLDLFLQTVSLTIKMVLKWCST
ncbi:hypothetical protein EB796_006366 [Bugula neritina]|uniref:WAP domain-containing protein n=1 Tax=Bugula neritina TaxID=10212 RepID=A0A7J7KAP0_BUGNE|nr:hypothetical protein EB796_006366 [Bugula neritina]